ncbi:MAG: MOSC domain-containing protein [Myxococcota bacterium]|nr:MOSC domain-containing protein [Myxococcota bacterium]
MSEFVVTLVSIHLGLEGEDERTPVDSVEAEAGGLAGDKYNGVTRVAQSWDPEPNGTIRRNERQWSAVSKEDLATLADRMDLAEPLAPATLGANLCFENAPGLSVLPKGSKLEFPSGAVLMVEEETLPCAEMGLEIQEEHTTRSGAPVEGRLFPKKALGLRGTLGFVDVPGELRVGDEVTVRPYDPPARVSE